MLTIIIASVCNGYSESGKESTIYGKRPNAEATHASVSIVSFSFVFGESYTQAAKELTSHLQ